MLLSPLASFSNAQIRMCTGLMLSALCVLLFCYLPTAYGSVSLIIILLTALIVEWPALCKGSKMMWFLTPLYPIAPGMMLIMLQHNPTTHPLFIWLVTTVAAFDTGAYCAGKKYGSHIIAPQISNGKTAEGFLGGTLAALIVSCVMLYWYNPHVSLLCGTSATIALCYSALIGDLFESALKRRVALKDSGTLLPGHGGIFDRIDGILCAAVLVFLFQSSFLTVFTRSCS